tara:strand:+ start:2370 stop:3812 length:1443 start_codon:yes stop_codon:yes gene_type:complete
MSTLNKVNIKQCLIHPTDVKSFLKDNPDGITGRGDSNIDKGNLEDEPDDKDKFPDLAVSKSITHIDYFEDILSPAVTCYVHVSDTNNLIAKMPIRGYERVDLEVILSEQDSFSFNENNTPFFVMGIENIQRTESQETFTLVLSTVGNLRNEVSRCIKKYQRASITSHIEEILLDTLKIDQERIELDNSATQYTFMGNNRKPFFTIVGLAPKAQPIKEGKASGTSGFVFFEDYGGYKFKSIDSLIKAADDEVQYLNDPKNKPRVPEFTYTTAIGRDTEPENNFKIIDHYIEKTVNIQKNLRVGLYSNLTSTVNPLNWKVENNTFKLKDQVNGSDGTSTMGVETPIPTSDVFGDEPSRRLVRITDHGMIDKDLKKDDDGEALTSGRDPQDMAKSFSRYSLLFQQSLNITIPCNNEIRVGQVVKVVLPDVGPSEQGDGGKDQKQADQELSGIYLVRAMRHHFELGDGKNVTSLNLVRDSYGLN